jgi:hypothetical protein
LPRCGQYSVAVDIAEEDGSSSADDVLVSQADLWQLRV